MMVLIVVLAQGDGKAAKEGGGSGDGQGVQKKERQGPKEVTEAGDLQVQLDSVFIGPALV